MNPICCVLLLILNTDFYFEWTVLIHVSMELVPSLFCICNFFWISLLLMYFMYWLKWSAGVWIDYVQLSTVPHSILCNLERQQTRLWICLCIKKMYRYLLILLICSFMHPIHLSIITSFTCLFVSSFVNLLVHSLIHPFIMQFFSFCSFFLFPKSVCVLDGSCV